MIKVLVNGAAGRMGQECVKAVNAEEGLELVATADIGDDLEQVISRTRPDVAVDFTVAGAGYANALCFIKKGVRPVVGTTGIKADEIRELQRQAAEKKLGGLVAPNFAIGAVLLMIFAKQAAKYLPDVEIIELHHDRKADSPSGTAIRTAEMILESRSEKPEPKVKEEKQLLPGARGAELDGVHIHSVRLPGLVAHEKVMFGGVGQTLTLQHDSLDRTSFMPGVCFACKKVMTVNELYYGLENLLG